jgi:8-oxo-dGTP diphosphatase
MEILPIEKLEEETEIMCAVDVAIFDADGKILLGKRLAKAGFGTWGFPGGHLKKDEKLIDAAQRELGEELGNNADIEVTDQILAVRENHLAPYFIHHIVTIIKGLYRSGKIEVSEPDKCEEWKWFDFDNLLSPLFSGVEETLKNYQNNKTNIVTDW